MCMKTHLYSFRLHVLPFLGTVVMLVFWWQYYRETYWWPLVVFFLSGFLTYHRFVKKTSQYKL